MNLTSNQQEVIWNIASGSVIPVLTVLKTLPSLISRGLVCVRMEEVRIPKRAIKTGTSPFEIGQVPRYLLTKEGFNFYSEKREAFHKTRLKDLEKSLSEDLLRAKGNTVSSGSDEGK